MKNFKSFLVLGFLLSIFYTLTACSDDTDKPEATGDHVWKTQTDALKTAKDVAGNLQESLNQQKEKLEDSD